MKDCIQQESKIPEHASKTCIFCKIAKKQIPSENIIYENSKIMAFMDIAPINPGHTLVIPKEHYRTILETPDNVVKELIITVKKIAKAVKEAVNADGLNIGINTEKAAGQIIFHTHFHIIPRFENDRLKTFPRSRYKTGQAENIKKEIIKHIK